MADLTRYQALAPGDDEPASLVDLLAAALPAWHRDALCREYPSVSFFPAIGESSAPARAICAACLVIDECLAYAVDDPSLGGVWGGTSARERGRLRRARIGPDAA